MKNDELHKFFDDLGVPRDYIGTKPATIRQRMDMVAGLVLGLERDRCRAMIQYDRALVLGNAFREFLGLDDD